MHRSQAWARCPATSSPVAEGCQRMVSTGHLRRTKAHDALHVSPVGCERWALLVTCAHEMCTLLPAIYIGDAVPFPALQDHSRLCVQQQEVVEVGVGVSAMDLADAAKYQDAVL